LLALVTLAARDRERSAGVISYRVQRGPLRITILEKGEVEALESQEIKSEVWGETKIISIVDEGYLVTEEDVQNKMVLVELDSSELKDRLTQKEIEFQGTRASLTEAQEQYQIQLKQNESDIKAAELQVKFKRMDLEKYLGSKLALDLLDRLGIKEISAEDIEEEDRAARALEFPSPQAADSSDAEVASPSEVETEEMEALQVEVVLTTEAQKIRDALDFLELAKDARLAGEAVQKRQKFETDILLAEEDLSTARDTYEWTAKLAQEDFVTETQRRQDEMAVTRSEIALESAKLAQELFITYEFPKQAETLLSDYEEALRGLSRTVKKARSQIAQSDAQLKSAEARYSLEKLQRDELVEQIGKCTIVAERAGLVVYGDNESRRYGTEPIRAGATVYRNESIITIPDMTKMALKVNIHESHIQKVQKGQKASIAIEAFADRELTGEVSKIGMLPDEESSWLNPDLKVYKTTVVIDGSHDWLKPGMTAKVDILIEELHDVLYVPIQAVFTFEGKRVTYLAQLGREPERRYVETGQFNGAFVEVKSGLNEGDVVLLIQPETPSRTGEKPAENIPGELPSEAPAETPAPENVQASAAE
jgi:multidrug resistance efflux pump